MDINPYLKLMAEKSASDLFFTADSPVMVKIDGRIVPVGKTVLSAKMVAQAVDGILDEHLRHQLKTRLEVDFALSRPDIGRFRVNAFHQRGAPAMVLRYIQNEVPNLGDLKMPPVLKELIMRKRGLVLMVGATGSGKTTTLAAMINHRNATSSGHILTIEDPIEFYHPHRKSIVNQRELGQDTLSYAAALRSSLREAPDVILVGETRDRETMEATIELAGTGHLAISTLHANNAHQTLDRIINMFPEELHKQLFMDLSINLQAIISQRLVRTIDGNRVAAIEIMLNTPHIADLILGGKIDEMKEAMEQSGVAGMQSFDQSLFDLLQAGTISREEALRNADSRANLEAKMNFG